jgi:hypothetical protein
MCKIPHIPLFSHNFKIIAFRTRKKQTIIYDRFGRIWHSGYFARANQIPLIAAENFPIPHNFQVDQWLLLRGLNLAACEPASLVYLHFSNWLNSVEFGFLLDCGWSVRVSSMILCEYLNTMQILVKFLSRFFVTYIVVSVNECRKIRNVKQPKVLRQGSHMLLTKNRDILIFFQKNRTFLRIKFF